MGAAFVLQHVGQSDGVIDVGGSLGVLASLGAVLFRREAYGLEDQSDIVLGFIVHDLILFRILALGFQHEQIAALQLHEKIRPVLPHNAAVDVQDFKAEMVALDPGCHLVAGIEHVCIRDFPGAVAHTDVDVRLLLAFARFAVYQVRISPGCRCAKTPEAPVETARAVS